MKYLVTFFLGLGLGGWRLSMFWQSRYLSGFTQTRLIIG